MTEYALRLANSQDTAPRVRAGDALPLVPNGPLTARSGIRGNGGVVSVVSGAMQVRVQPFAAWVDGGSSDAQGGYPFVLDAMKVLTVSDGHATLPRIDIVGVRVRETTFDGSGSTDAQVIVVQGVPGAGSPALPTTFLPLRSITVPAGTSTGTGGLTSGMLGTDMRVFLAAGVLPVASLAERNALAGLGEGQVVYRRDTDRLELWDGAGWRIYSPGDSANVAMNPPGNADTPAAGSATWVTLGNVDVPQGFTQARLMVCINGAMEVAAGGDNVSIAVTVGAASTALRRIVGTASPNRFSFTWSDVITGLSAGSQSVTVTATRVAGTSAYRVDSNSTISVALDFKP